MAPDAVHTAGDVRDAALRSTPWRVGNLRSGGGGRFAAMRWPPFSVVALVVLHLTALHRSLLELTGLPSQ